VFNQRALDGTECDQHKQHWGSKSNQVSPGVDGATIAGGGAYSFLPLPGEFTSQTWSRGIWTVGGGSLIRQPTNGTVPEARLTSRRAKAVCGG